MPSWPIAIPDGSFRLLPENKLAPDGAAELVDASEVARYLGAKLLQPLAKHLQGKRRWIISPDGPLAQLAFETLPFESSSGATVLAAADIQYTQSLSVYALSRQLQQRYSSLRERKTLLAVGNPQYEAEPPTTRALPKSNRSLRATNLRAVAKLSELNAQWQDLPGTETEVKAVASLFPGSVTTLLREQATEQQLQRLNASGELKNYRYLLLSTHGFVSAEQPALSSVVLGLRKTTPEADGYLTASEWPGYDLRSDLTVLSGCDTAVGPVLSGEGVMGLPYALFVAGNVNTILSLWPVDDEATALFMTGLFAKLKAGQSATVALAATKREFAKHPRFSHPMFWAPFILVGAG